MKTKSQLSQNPDSFVNVNNNENRDTRRLRNQVDKFKVLLIGTSNIRVINEAFLANATQVTKATCYSLYETMRYIDESTDVSNAVMIIYTLANDLKTMYP
jgi:hypothetical protein